MGGYLVQIYTLIHPERVMKAISISGTVPVGGKKNSMAAMMKIFLPEALFPTDRNVTKLLRKLSGENYAVFTENREIMAHYKSLLKGFNNMAMGYHKLHAFTPEDVGRIRDKVTYLVGTEDPFEKIGGRDVLVQNRMNAVFYEKAGHGLNHEQAEEINRKMIAILQCTEEAYRLWPVTYAAGSAAIQKECGKTVRTSRADSPERTSKKEKKI